MSDAVIVALISAATTIITALAQKRRTDRNAAKQSILQMIGEDQLAVLYGGIPTNYQNVLHEYDIYHKNGGNSYVTEKVEDYKKWYVAWEHQHIDK
jgi:hypothetical protein